MTAPPTGRRHAGGPVATRRARADAAPDLEHLRAEVARVDALTAVEWDHLITEAPPHAWEDAQRAWAAFQQALAGGHRTRAQAALLTLGTLLEAGADDRRHTENFIRLVDQKRRLVETYARMLHAAGRRLTPEDIGVLLEVLRAAAVQAGVGPAGVARIVAICNARLQRLKAQPGRPTRSPSERRSVLGHQHDRGGEPGEHNDINRPT